MPTPSPANVLLGRGALYFDRYTSAGARTGFRHLGNCDTFSIGIETETLDLKDYTQQTSANYASVLTSTNVNLSIAGYEFDAENLALALLGTASAFTQSSGNVTGEVLAASTVTGLKGKFFKTAAVNISSVAVKQGATTYTAGTDYTVYDAKAGIIQILTTGGVTDGTNLTVDYTKAAVVAGDGRKRITGATLAECVGELLFNSNNSTGGNKMVRVFKASITPNGELGFISDEFGKFTLTGKALSDAAGTYGGSVSEPYFIVQDIA
jgi:hypothetical protein